MMRGYKEGDELRLEFNKFSDPATAPEVFMDDTYVKETLEDGGEVKAIVCWKEIAPRSIAGFFLVSKNIGMSHCRELKLFIKELIVNLRLELVLTYSVDCDELNKWHEFLGFNKEEDGRVSIGDKSLNKWVMRWV